MIRVAFTHNRLTLYGHADHAPRGEDIVCSAASSLVYALVGYLEKRGEIRELVMRRGYVTVAAAGYSPAFEIVRCGMQQIAAAYPECVELMGHNFNDEKGNENGI